MDKSFRFIAIEGNIGVGKTTFAKALAKINQVRFAGERFEKNPFLIDFYKDRDQFAFDTELFFLEDRHAHFQELFLNDKSSIVTDFTLYKSDVFAGITLVKKEYEKFKSEFELRIQDTVHPDLIIFLMNDPTQKLERIRNRGRDFEQNIEEEYLRNLENAYLKYLKSLSQVKVLILDLKGFSFPYSDIELTKIMNLLKRESFNGIKYLYFNDL